MAASTRYAETRAVLCTISNRTTFLTELRRIGTAHDVRIICFNADMIAGRAHAVRALELAERAFEAGENISNTIEMEALLFAAGSRQCSVASAFGIHEGENRLYVCCRPERAEAWHEMGSLFNAAEEGFETIGPEKRANLVQAFSLSEAEITAAGGDSRIPDLVLERVAMLQVLR